MLRSPRALVAAPKPAFRGVSRLWFRLPSVLNWLFTIVRFVGLVNCADEFRPLMSTVLNALKTSAQLGTVSLTAGDANPSHERHVDIPGQTAAHVVAA